MQDAVGDLLGNMGGAGMRTMNADRRRQRIMQSRGTRALGEGPQAAAANVSGPAAASAQHRYNSALLRLQQTARCCTVDAQPCAVLSGAGPC